ncbi:MAG: sugar transferase [Clostridia bacterium]|nr:sugar transferase [Clostridia bacterium]
MYIRVKRLLDFILSLMAICGLSWLLIILALLIKLEDGGNILFKQKRIGLNKREFYIYKFRTMKITTPKDVPTHLLENPESYITHIGKFLRISSMDELPQLFNILKGEMSLIGPRPALWNQFDLIAERDKYGANGVVPGLTGWAQVNGRDELPIEIKSKYDGEYVKKMSLLFDIYIIIRTVISVFMADGVKEGKNEDNTDGEK